MTRIKICGLTRAEDVTAAVEAGADALGFVLAPSSRRLSIDQARSLLQTAADRAMRVLVTVDPDFEAIKRWTKELPFEALQLHGSESPDFCARLRELLPGKTLIKAFRVDGLPLAADHYEVDAFLLDSGAGTGRTFDWESVSGLEALRRPFWVAGGLDDRNVAEAIARFGPYGVDVSSGVELSPGLKDPVRMARFATAVRAAAEGDKMTPPGMK